MRLYDPSWRDRRWKVKQDGSSISAELVGIERLCESNAVKDLSGDCFTSRNHRVFSANFYRAHSQPRSQLVDFRLRSANASFTTPKLRMAPAVTLLVNTVLIWARTLGMS